VINLLNSAIETLELILKEKLNTSVRFRLLSNKKKLKESLAMLQDMHMGILATHAIIENDELKLVDNRVQFENKEKEIECMKQLIEMNKMDFCKDIFILNISDVESGLEKLDDKQLESVLFMFEV